MKNYKNDTTSLKKHFFILFFIWCFSSNLGAAISSIYLLNRNVSLSWIGYLSSIGAFIIILFEFPTGIIADRYGNSLSILIGLFADFISTFIIIFAFGPYIFMLYVIISSIGSTFTSGAFDAWIINNDRTVKDDFGKFYSHLSIIRESARLSAGFIGALLFNKMQVLPYVSSVILICIVIIYFLLVNTKADIKIIRREINIETKKSLIITRIISDAKAAMQVCIKDRGLNLMIYIGILFIFFAIAPLLYWQPLISNRLQGLSSYSFLGIIFSTKTVFTILGSVVFARCLSLFKNYIRLFSVSILLAGISILLVGIIDNIVLTVIFLSLYNFFLGIIGPIRGRILNERIPDEKRASILSFFSLTDNLGQVLAGLIIGYLLNYITVGLLIGCTSVLCLVTAILSFNIPIVLKSNRAINIEP